MTKLKTVKKIPPHFVKTKSFEELLEETKKMEYRVAGTLLTLALIEDRG